MATTLGNGPVSQRTQICPWQKVQATTHKLIRDAVEKALGPTHTTPGVAGTIGTDPTQQYKVQQTLTHLVLVTMQTDTSHLQW